MHIFSENTVLVPSNESPILKLSIKNSLVLNILLDMIDNVGQGKLLFLLTLFLFQNPFPWMSFDLSAVFHNVHPNFLIA